MFLKHLLFFEQWVFGAIKVCPNGRGLWLSMQFFDSTPVLEAYKYPERWYHAIGFSFRAGHTGFYETSKWRLSF